MTSQIKFSVFIGCLFLAMGFCIYKMVIESKQGIPKENKFITDSNGCQYFKKSERPRFNPNGTQICKPL